MICLLFFWLACAAAAAVQAASLCVLITGSAKTDGYNLCACVDDYAAANFQRLIFYFINNLKAYI